MWINATPEAIIATISTVIIIIVIDVDINQLGRPDLLTAIRKQKVRGLWDANKKKPR